MAVLTIMPKTLAWRALGLPYLAVVALQRLCRACRYVLANIETKAGVRRGDRVWQIAFGSGFKCNSAIWRALRNVNTPHSVWT